MNSQPFLIHNNSALFIDRDGVLNKLRVNDYVKQISELELLPEVYPALKILRPLFKRIFIVTNQQGIGKKIMIDSIDSIHSHLLSLIANEVHPDKIYHCPHLKELECVCRKPNTGMALMAKNDYPEIQLTHSFMIGDSISDMEFAKNSGMRPIFISKSENNEFPTFTSILDFAIALIKK